MLVADLRHRLAMFISGHGVFMGRAIAGIPVEPSIHSYAIVSESSYTGKHFLCTSTFDGQQVFSTWAITSGSQYATINGNGRVDIVSGTVNQPITLQCTYVSDGKTYTADKMVTVSYDNELKIECADTLTGTSGNAIARYNDEIVTPTWSIDGTGATIDVNGAITITASGIVVIHATYNNQATSKTVNLEYVANKSSTTTVDENGSVTTTTTETVTNPDGSTTDTSTSVTVHDDGSVSNTSSETTTQEDGSSTTTSTTTNQDGTSSQTQATGNSDGSSSSVTNEYNAEGDITKTVNGEVDVDGNASIQDVEYNSSGDPVVTGYAIDTSGSEEGEKTFDTDGVNTQFYGFDSVEGFELDLHFTFDFTDQPPDQHENHHQILCMKRADPSPWYGFQIRQSSTNKYVQLGTQFEFGSNTYTTIPANWIEANKIAEYHVHVVYDPSLYQNTFVMTNVLTGNKIFSSNYLFPDLPELRYLTVCLGYALDANGQPYRYSKINVLGFSLKKLVRIPAVPTFAFSENVITMTCETTGADIYYRPGNTSTFSEYTDPITITENVTMYAYSSHLGHNSETVSQTFVYDDGIDEPVITCDGEFVEINCGTSGADVFYRIGTSGNFQTYESPFEINATCTVQAYATIDDKQSETVSEICTYTPVTLVAPEIMCDNNYVIITCETARSSIYYRTNQIGEFRLYQEPFSISQDTLVEAYSTYKQQTSTIVSEECEYTPEHDYSNDYLTFKVLTPGTISWKAFGGLTKTIEYSVNNGAWTSITSTAEGATISVVKDDKVRFRGENTVYATSKSAYSGFEGGTATYDIEGNIMSLLYEDGFASNSNLPNSSYIFCSLFKKAPVVSARNLILPAMTLKTYCYRALFSWCTTLAAPPALPATTLASGCYWYMFEQCGIMKAPVLDATTLVSECYGHMFEGCAALNTIECYATSGFGASKCLLDWTLNVAATGIFVKSSSATSWSTGTAGIPTGWTVSEDMLLYPPTVFCDGETIELECETEEATIYYRLNQTGEFQVYTMPITMIENTIIETYSSYGVYTSTTVTESCTYVQETPYQMSNKDLPTWRYAGNTITTPYSVNRIDGHSSNYAKGTFSFETSITLKTAQPTYLWFQHADQSADIYVDDTKVGTHWGGYNAFFFDISNYVHRGVNNIRVALCNTTRSSLAPAAGDFNFNATLGNVKLFTSPVLPAMEYGYDGFHITSTVNSSSATIYVKTKIPSGASVVCRITDGNFDWTQTKPSTGQEMTFSTIISGNNLHLWNGTIDPHLYTVTMEVYKDNELYHSYSRPYGFRYYQYVINQIINGSSYTGFLLNGAPYLLRGVCMHDDLAGKANALNNADYAQEFAIIRELGCNFIRLAHYPHPKEVYDLCDQYGIIVQTEVPCVNKLQSTMPEDYYTHLTDQYKDMVNQHYNHPCIIFWGLSNETSTDDKDFGKAKIEEYYALIRGIDPERLIGYVMSHSYSNPSSYYNNPAVDWFGCNLYVGWYIEKASNDPTAALNTRVKNLITGLSKPFALSEYGAGGTQHCHSEDFKTTTTTGNYARHDIEYQMWLHEGHIASIRNFPQLLFTSQWQLFDIAVSNRNEGYTECLDGENTTTNDELRRLNNKGLVERDHVTKKDTFYIYKAEWNPTPFVHICGKDYTKITDRKLKCYTNDGNTLSMYIGDSQTAAATAQVVDHIAVFDEMDFTSGVQIRVSSTNASDTVTF